MKYTKIIFVFIVLGFIACSKESSIVVVDDIPEIEPTFIETDTSYSIDNQHIDVTKAVIRFNKLLSDSIPPGADCFFSLVIKTGNHSSFIGLFPYVEPFQEGLVEGTYDADIVVSYSEEYLQELEDWTQNGADPNAYPVFNPNLHITVYEDVSLQLDIAYLTEGDNVPIVEEYCSAFGIPVIDPNTNEPKTIRYVKDACILTKRGYVNTLSGERIEISGFIEGEYHRQL